MENGVFVDTNRKAELLQELENPEYRRAFVEAHAKDTIAFQIRQLRKAENWDQRRLAEELGNAKLQPMVSRYENPDYGRYSISTLLDLASAFDVALAVRFVPFSELVEWDWSSSTVTLCPPKYAKDMRLQTLAAKTHGLSAAAPRLQSVSSAKVETQQADVETQQVNDVVWPAVVSSAVAAQNPQSQALGATA